MNDIIKKVATFTACTFVAGIAIGILFPGHIIEVKIYHELPYQIRIHSDVNNTGYITGGR